MTHQKSEDRNKPQSRRKTALTQSDEPPGGGKAVPVVKQAKQLVLPFGPAGSPESKDNGAAKKAIRRHKRPAVIAVPQPEVRIRSVKLASIESVALFLDYAFENVAANKGAPGPDGQTIAHVREHLGEVLGRLRRSLLDGTYQPGDIRRVWIPKSGGGQRGLGIPNVVDRVVQEAVRMVLEPLYEPFFHVQSHGFRPERGCHTAIAQAQEFLREGFEWVADLDLEQFFDRVNHQRLLARLSQQVGDRRLLGLISGMLTTGVIMPDGVRVSTDEGLPQGGPLSPLLSNIVLDELDTELARRGHRFVRYADDCNIYVRSERAGQRVMASITRFIEKRLRLKVNAKKSAVARPGTRHFLGFRLRPKGQGEPIEILLSDRSKTRLEERVRELTPRNWGGSVADVVDQVNAYTRGWLCHFGICTQGNRGILHETDSHIRRRLRALQLKHWKRKRTIKRRLIRLGARKGAHTAVYGDRRSWWALSNHVVVRRTLSNAYWESKGFQPVVRQWESKSRHLDVSVQQRLPLRW